MFALPERAWKEAWPRLGPARWVLHELLFVEGAVELAAAPEACSDNIGDRGRYISIFERCDTGWAVELSTARCPRS